MFLRRFTDFILQSRLQAVLVAFLVAFIPLIGSISVVIAALITLRKGIWEGFWVAIAATIPYLLSYAVNPAAGDIDFTTAALAVLIVSNLLTWLFAAFLRKYQHWGFTLEIAALFGVAVVIIVHVIYPDVQGWWQTQLNVYLSKTTAMVSEAKADAEVTAVQTQMVSAMKRYATGFVVASVLFNALLQLLVARWWQALVFNPGGLRAELHRIRLSYVSGVVFVIGLLLSYLNNAVALDAIPVLFLAFFIAGLSVLHYLIVPARANWMLLMFLYLAVIWLFPASIVIVSLIGLSDTTVNIRQRFGRTN
jgi:hypothetical protein